MEIPSGDLRDDLGRLLDKDKVIGSDKPKWIHDYLGTEYANVGTLESLLMEHCLRIRA